MIREPQKRPDGSEGVPWASCAAWGIAVAVVAACGGSTSTSSASGDAGTPGDLDGGVVADGSSPQQDGVDASPAQTAGTVSLVAGGGTGGAEGVGSAADVGSPSALAYDGVGTLYVADTLLRVLKVDLATNTVTRIPGSHHATGLAFDRTNNVLYYIDQIDAQLTTLDPTTGVGTPVAGAFGAAAAVDAVGLAARFQKPGRLTWSEGFVYMTDGCAIRAFEIGTQAVTTVVGSTTECTYKEGAFATARFGAAAGGPLGLVMGPSQTLFVADRDNFVIRAVHLDTKATNLIAGAGYGHADGPAPSASFQEVKDVAWDGAHSRIYVAGTGGMVRRIQLGASPATSAVTTVAGAWPGEGTFMPGSPGALIRPEGVVVVGADVIGADLHVLFRVTGL